MQKGIFFQRKSLTGPRGVGMLPKGKRFPPIIETNDPAPFEKTC